ncbi:PLP-dependent aspartate aminotransferase family protein [Ferrimicrobium sp.]|uniref:trans-sulfuration enzyme family protein n=1 Tax=Ferrimicrobium sp. TaxID=2926050 RepID=UPI002627D6D2|nr:PLP-dependent aspartate aminotransferase family protein [Ferrimicrobium sp.]
MDTFTKLQLPVVEDRLHGPNPAVSLNATYYEGQRVVYGRHSNSTWEALETLIGELEGGIGVSFASGQAAMFASSLLATSRLVISEDTYVGSRDLADFMNQRALIPCTYVAESSLRHPSGLTTLQEGDVLMIESPSNPLLVTYDIAALAAVCHQQGALLAVDNTVATPILQNPLGLGADIVVHSATKFISGHSDVLAGLVIVADEELARRLFEVRAVVGSIIGPVEAYLCFRGAKTLGVRVRHASASAAWLADALADRLGRNAVFYPGFDEKLVGEGRQQSSGGALLSLVLDGAERADRFVDALQVFHHATSLGGVESLAERRSKYSGEERLPVGLVRLSVGLEATEDLWADIDQALRIVGVERVN